MKKILKIILVIALIVVGLCVLAGVVLFFVVKNIDANKLRPQITSQIEEALGRATKIGDLDVGISLAQGLSVSVSDVSIADDAAFSTKPFVSVAKLSLGLDLVGMIVKRQVSISGIEIKSPHISLIRNEEGVFNFQSLAVLTKGATPASSASASSSAVTAGVAVLLVKNIALRDGVLHFEDHLDEDKILQITKADLSIADFSLLNPFKVQLRAAVLSDAQNVKVTSFATIDVLHAAGILKNLHADIDLSTMDVKAVSGILPSMSQAKLQNPLKGSFACDADEITLSAQGAAIKKLDGQLTAGELKTSYLTVPLANIEGKMQIVGSDLTIDSVLGKLGQGEVHFKGTIKDYLATQDYHFIVSADNISVAEVVHQGNQDISLEGLVSAQSIIQGKILEKLAALDFDSGNVTFRFKDGKLRNINVLRVVLDKMSMLPDLTAKLLQTLPENYKAQLEQNDTTISAVDLDMDIQSGQMNIRSAKAQTDVFTLTGKGSMDFHLNTQMEARIAIPQDLSKSMMGAVEELKFLANNDGQIVIPLTIEGKIPDRLKYLPDLDYLGRQLFETQGRQELGRLLDKVLKQDNGPGARGTEGQADSSAKASQGEAIVNSVLDAIFKK